MTSNKYNKSAARNLGGEVVSLVGPFDYSRDGLFLARPARDLRIAAHYLLDYVKCLHAQGHEAAGMECCALAKRLLRGCSPESPVP